MDTSRTRQVLRRYDWSRTTLWRRVRAGEFPRPIKLSPGLNAWINAELDEHDERLRRARDASSKAA